MEKSAILKEIGELAESTILPDIKSLTIYLADLFVDLSKKGIDDGKAETSEPRIIEPQANFLEIINPCVTWERYAIEKAFLIERLSLTPADTSAIPDVIELDDCEERYAIMSKTEKELNNK